MFAHFGRPSQAECAPPHVERLHRGFRQRPEKRENVEVRMSTTRARSVHSAVEWVTIHFCEKHFLHRKFRQMLQCEYFENRVCRLQLVVVALHLGVVVVLADRLALHITTGQDVAIVRYIDQWIASSHTVR